MPMRNVSWSSVGRVMSCAAVAVALMGLPGTTQARSRHWLHRHGGAVSHHRVPGPHHRFASAPLSQAGPAFAAMVLDANSGRTLYAVNEDAPRHPASITKVMTLYLLFEELERGHLRLDSPLEVSAHAAAQAPTKLGLRPGSSITVENAIKAIVTKSANDMAVAVAENVAGSEPDFAAAMTAKAHALGMSHTFYHNASGLPDDRQLTTARDLTILGRAIHDRFPRFYHYFSTPSFTYAGSFMPNHNHLLGRVDGMDGIKTGYTNASGFNLLSSVNRDGRHIVSVVLGGRTAAGRDRIMESLIETHIEEASATPSSRFAEATPVEEAAPPPRHIPEPAPFERDPPTGRAYIADQGPDPEGEAEGDVPMERLPPRGPNLIAPDLALPPPVVGRMAVRAHAPRELIAPPPVRVAAVERGRPGPSPSVTFAAIPVPDDAPRQIGPREVAQRTPLPPRPPEDLARPAFIAGVPKVIDAAQSPAPPAERQRRRLVLDGSTNRRTTIGAGSGATVLTATPSSLHWVAGPPPAKFGPSAEAARAAAAAAAAKAAASDGPTGSIVERGPPDEAAVAQADKAPAEQPAASRGGWFIQIGATDDAGKANDLLARAKTEGRSALASARPFTEKVQKGEATLYRARFAGLAPSEAEAACRTLKRSGFACFATRD